MKTPSTITMLPITFLLSLAICLPSTARSDDRTPLGTLQASAGGSVHTAGESTVSISADAEVPIYRYDTIRPGGATATGAVEYESDSVAYSMPLFAEVGFTASVLFDGDGPLAPPTGDDQVQITIERLVGSLYGDYPGGTPDVLTQTVNSSLSIQAPFDVVADSGAGADETFEVVLFNYPSFIAELDGISSEQFLEQEITFSLFDSAENLIRSSTTTVGAGTELSRVDLTAGTYQLGIEWDWQLDSISSTPDTAGDLWVFGGWELDAILFAAAGDNVRRASVPDDPVGPAVVVYEGDLDLSTSLITLIELGGLAPGEFDRNEVAGTLMLGGDLRVELVEDHTLGPNERYEIYTAGTLNGMFDNAGDGELVANLGGIDLYIDYSFDNGTVTLFTVPEPRTVALLGLPLLLICGRRWAQQQADSTLSTTHAP